MSINPINTSLSTASTTSALSIYYNESITYESNLNSQLDLLIDIKSDMNYNKSQLLEYITKYIDMNYNRIENEIDEYTREIYVLLSEIEMNKMKLNEVKFNYKDNNKEINSNELENKYNHIISKSEYFNNISLNNFSIFNVIKKDDKKLMEWLKNFKPYISNINDDEIIKDKTKEINNDPLLLNKLTVLESENNELTLKCKQLNDRLVELMDSINNRNDNKVSCGINTDIPIPTSEDEAQKIVYELLLSSNEIIDATENKLKKISKDIFSSTIQLQNTNEKLRMNGYKNDFKNIREVGNYLKNRLLNFVRTQDSHSTQQSEQYKKIINKLKSNYQNQLDVEKENQIKLVEKVKLEDKLTMEYELKDTVSKYEAMMKKYDDLETKNKDSFTHKMNELIAQNNKQKEELRQNYEQQIESIKNNFVSTHDNYKEKFKNAIESLKAKHVRDNIEINNNVENLNSRLKEMYANHENVVHENKLKLENIEMENRKLLNEKTRNLELEYKRDIEKLESQHRQKIVEMEDEYAKLKSTMNAMEHKFSSELNLKINSLSLVHTEQINFLQEKIENNKSSFEKPTQVTLPSPAQLQTVVSSERPAVPSIPKESFLTPAKPPLHNAYNSSNPPSISYHHPNISTNTLHFTSPLTTVVKRNMDTNYKLSNNLFAPSVSSEQIPLNSTNMGNKEPITYNTVNTLDLNIITAPQPEKKPILKMNTKLSIANQIKNIDSSLHERVGYPNRSIRNLPTCTPLKSSATERLDQYILMSPYK